MANYTEGKKGIA